MAGGIPAPLQPTTSKVEKPPRPNSNDYNPMWTGGKVWFLSDREGPVTLYSYDSKTKKVVRAPNARAASSWAFFSGPEGCNRESSPPEVADVSAIKMFRP